MKPFTKLILAASMVVANSIVAAADVPVYVATAESREIAPTREFPGRVISDSNVSLSAEVSGKVVWIQALGAQVKQNEVLARIDDSLLRIAKDQAEEAVSDLHDRLSLAQKRRARHNELSKDNYVAQNRLDTLDSEIAELNGKLQQAKLTLANRKELLNRTEIKAPISGRVTERLAKAGEWVDQSDVVLRMIDDSDLEVSIRVPSAFAANVSANDPVSIRSVVGIVSGKLRLKAVQPDFEFYELRVDFTQESFPAGMPVNVGFAMAGFQTTQVVVPADALQVRNGKVGLFKIDAQQQAVYVPVSTIAMDKGWAAVEGQINDGDTVVIRGVERLTHGQTVKQLTPEVELALKN